MSRPAQFILNKGQQYASRFMPKTPAQALGFGFGTAGATMLGLFKFRDQMLDAYDSDQYTDQEVMYRSITKFGPQFVKNNLLPVSHSKFMATAGKESLRYLRSNEYNNMSVAEVIDQMKNDSYKYITRKRKIY